MTDRDSALDRALDHAYDVFGAASPPRQIDACSCCVRPEEVAILASTAPRELDDTMAHRLLGKLGTTIVGRETVRWFTPRLLAYWRLDDSVDVVRVGRKLADAEWTTWPEGEVAAIRGVAEAAVAEAIESKACMSHLFDDLLCSLASLDDDLTPYLGVWSRAAPRARSLALLGLIPKFGERLISGGEPLVWWDDVPHAFRRLLDFVGDPVRLQEARAFLDDPQLDEIEIPGLVAQWMQALDEHRPE